MNSAATILMLILASIDQFYIIIYKHNYYYYVQQIDKQEIKLLTKYSTAMYVTSYTVTNESILKLGSSSTNCKS